MTLSDFLTHVESPRQTARGWTALCPAHDDRSPSLSISEGDDGRILVKCWAACTAQEIVEAMGLRLSDLFKGNQTVESRNQHREIRKKSKAIKSAEIFLAGAYRSAEKVLKAAKGVDISGWTGDERDRKMNMVCDAYLVLAGEKNHEY